MVNAARWRALLRLKGGRVMKRLITVSVAAMVMVFFILSVSMAASEGSKKGATGKPLPNWSEYPWEYKHKVKDGEFLFMLAGYYYGDCHKWNWIYATNKNRIKNPNRIRVGQTLIIKLPRGWEAPMPYEKWYQRTKYTSPSGKAGGMSDVKIPGGYVLEPFPEQARAKEEEKK